MWKMGGSVTGDWPGQAVPDVGTWCKVLADGRSAVLR